MIRFSGDMEGSWHRQTLDASTNQGVPKCAVRDVLDRVGDSWSVLVVLRLGDEPCRFNELRRRVGVISQRMLTVTLRHLERDGLVTRHVLPSTPPQVEYRLTNLGRSLLGPIATLSEWAFAHQPEIQQARFSYDERRKPSAATA